MPAVFGWFLKSRGYSIRSDPCLRRILETCFVEFRKHFDSMVGGYVKSNCCQNFSGYMYIYIYVYGTIYTYIYISIRCISMQEKPCLGAKKLMELIEDHITTSLG